MTQHINRIPLTLTVDFIPQTMAYGWQWDGLLDYQKHCQQEVLNEGNLSSKN